MRRDDVKRFGGCNHFCLLLLSFYCGGVKDGDKDEEKDGIYEREREIVPRAGQ